MNSGKLLTWIHSLGIKKLDAQIDSASETSWSGLDSDSNVDCDESLQNPIATEHVPGRQYAVTTTYLLEPVDDIYAEAANQIIAAHRREPLPGDILVFMTGQEDVESVCSLIEEQAASLPPSIPKLQILPLYAALGPSQQNQVFEPTPKHTRKVIISTNIAESSVTIPGVRMVIDNGLVKVKEFRSSLGLDSLLVKPISKSAAIQRKGRAGREGPGKCLRLYTEESYLNLETEIKPEILRSDLAGVVLTMKARGIQDVIGFPLLSPPPKETLRSALLQLLRLGAIDDKGAVTRVGKQMARLPLSPALSRVLIAAAELERSSTTSYHTDTGYPETSLTLAVIDIVSALVSEPFFIPQDNLSNSDPEIEEENAARLEARAALNRRHGDHLTYLAALRSYGSENTDRKLWSDKHLVNHRAMKSVLAVRKQLRAMLVKMRMLSENIVEEAEQLEGPGQGNESERVAWLHPTENMSDNILRCFLQGFTSNVARLCKDGAYRTIESNHVIRVHPASVMASRKVEGIVYSELVFTRRNYARGVSAVQLQWYAETMGMRRLDGK